jgi:hypothetical protein
VQQCDSFCVDQLHPASVCVLFGVVLVLMGFLICSTAQFVSEALVLFVRPAPFLASRSTRARVLQTSVLSFLSARRLLSCLAAWSSGFLSAQALSNFGSIFLFPAPRSGFPPAPRIRWHFRGCPQSCEWPLPWLILAYAWSTERVCTTPMPFCCLPIFPIYFIRT